MNQKILLFIVLMVACLISVVPAIAQDNPYHHIGDITKKDIPVNLDSEFARMSNTSDVKFTGAEYTHSLGRVSIKMKLLLEGVDKDITSSGNVRTSGVEQRIKYTIYKDLIKEEITLKTPKTVRYSYDLWLSDWVTKTIDTSKLQKNHNWRGLNKTEIESQLSEKEVIDYARNSTIDIQPDRWGNLVILVNNKDVVVMPRPFAIDATGKRFDLDYNLDKKNKIITITGNLSEARYPLTIDPTERVTNGDFETGDLSGWTFSASGDYAGDCYVWVWWGNNAPYDQDTYTCFFVVAGANTTSRISQTVNLIDPVTLFFQRHLYGWNDTKPNTTFSAKIANTTIYSHDCVDSPWTPVEENINGFTGPQELSFELSSIADNGIDDFYGLVMLDQISVGMNDFSRPTVDFIANSSAGPTPLVVQFTDLSAHSPTSWLWEFGDGGESTEQNPSHTYEAAGIYDVILTARNYFGYNFEHKVCYITVIDLPVTDFTANPFTGTAPLDIQFIDTSTGSPTSWSWDFGDGGTSTDQNPLYIYTAAGTYTVNLTATNAGGSNTITKVGYITVTEEQVSNQATDIAGRSITYADIDNAAAKQEAMGYNPTTYYLPTRDTVKSKLSNDQIFFFSGHGGSGSILPNENNNDLFWATNEPNGYDFNAASTAYDEMKLAVFLACHSGDTDSTAGNLVDIVTYKGASCAIGWNGNIVEEGATVWSDAFWDQIQNGETVLSAYNDGRVAAENLDLCQYLATTNPELYGYDCNLGSLYFMENDGQCSQPLPNGLSNQILKAKTTLNSKDMKSNSAPLSYEEKEQVGNAVLTFTKEPIDIFSSKNVYRYSYADLYKVNSGDTSFWVNHVNGRVQSMVIPEQGSKAQKKIINLNQGSKIAESYAKEKYPELWAKTDNKKIKQTIKKIDNRGSDQILEYSWQEILINPDVNTTYHSEILGLNTVSVTVSPYTGKVTHYHEWYIPYNLTLNLTPSLTDDEAISYAEAYFQEAGFEKIQSTQITSHGLSMAIDKNNNQHLTWSLEIDQNDANGFDKRGFAGIDAHNGQVIWHASIN